MLLQQWDFLLQKDVSIIRVEFISRKKKVFSIIMEKNLNFLFPIAYKEAYFFSEM